MRYTRTSHHSGIPERRILPILADLGAIATMVLFAGATRVGPASSYGVGVNPIARGNRKPGEDTSVRNIRGSGNPSIQRFWTDINANVRSAIGFAINTPASAYSISGYYQGLFGARKVASFTPYATLPQVQPQCIIHVATDLR